MLTATTYIKPTRFCWLVTNKRGEFNTYILLSKYTEGITAELHDVAAECYQHMESHNADMYTSITSYNSF